jgi:hypothetical protein
LLRRDSRIAATAPFAIGLRLSALAARELRAAGRLADLRRWLAENDCYVFTINGFPYGGFHGMRVKEQVFQPDWASPARLDYTRDLFHILGAVAPIGGEASVSTLPGSHKSFAADERLMHRHLLELAIWLDELAAQTGHDFHLGLEPEPLGHFENTAETLAFFERLHAMAGGAQHDVIRRRIGVNFDVCHFALEYEAATTALDSLCAAGIRISKIHLSSALAFDPRDPAALVAIRRFDEPVYFHQVLLRDEAGGIRRFADLADFFAADSAGAVEARVHFHIPLDVEPSAPLRSTRDQVRAILAWRRDHPQACSHYEIETYTWSVLPGDMRRPAAGQIAAEFRWELANAG